MATDDATSSGELEVYLVIVGQGCDWLNIPFPQDYVLGTTLANLIMTEVDLIHDLRVLGQPVRLRNSRALILFQRPASEARLFLVGCEAAFFDVGNLQPREMKEKLINLVRTSHDEYFKCRFDAKFEEDSFERMRRRLKDAWGVSFREVTRAWMNVTSAEIILTTTTKFPYNMVYPYCKVEQQSQVSEFVHTYRLSKPKEFDFEDVSDLIKPILKQFDKKIVEIFVGYLSPKTKQNIYYPKDGGMLGQIGIVVTPTKELYEEYLQVGSVSWLPRRVPLMGKDSRGSPVMIGCIPVSIEDPVTATPMDCTRSICKSDQSPGCPSESL